MISIKRRKHQASRMFRTLRYFEEHGNSITARVKQIVPNGSSGTEGTRHKIILDNNVVILVGGAAGVSKNDQVSVTKILETKDKYVVTLIKQDADNISTFHSGRTGDQIITPRIIKKKLFSTRKYI